MQKLSSVFGFFLVLGIAGPLAGAQAAPSRPLANPLHGATPASGTNLGSPSGDFDPLAENTKARDNVNQARVAASHKAQSRPRLAEHRRDITEAQRGKAKSGPFGTIGLKTGRLTGPVTYISAASFEDDPKTIDEAATGNAVVRMLPGAGTYSADPSHSFSTPRLVVRAGASVTFINTDDIVHFNKDDKNEFQTPVLKPGMSFSHTFRKPGIYNYQCIPHPWMRGTIIVR